MNKIVLSFLMLFSPCFIACEERQDVYALISYGYGDNFENAQKSYLSLTPCQSSSFLCCEQFTIDSLRSAIFNSMSYVQDLCNTVTKSIGDNVFVGIGHSRGAEMLLHYVGDHNPKNLQALVLFATPVSVGQAVKSKLSGDPKSVPDKTLESMRKIKNKKLPIILFHQKNDKLISCEHSKLLCKAFKSHGFRNVYLVLMDNGGHNHLIDFAGYEILQTFYKHFNMPYDTTDTTLTDIEFLQFKQ
jgi:predicted esterase